MSNPITKRQIWQLSVKFDKFRNYHSFICFVAMYFTITFCNWLLNSFTLKLPVLSGNPQTETFSHRIPNIFHLRCYRFAAFSPTKYGRKRSPRAPSVRRVLPWRRWCRPRRANAATAVYSTAPSTRRTRPIGRRKYRSKTWVFLFFLPPGPVWNRIACKESLRHETKTCPNVVAKDMNEIRLCTAV